MTPLLEVDALTARFRVDGCWQTAVDRLTFSLGVGETLAIVGGSGSGKSVTALSIMRLLAIANGRIGGSVRLAGRELLALAEDEMRQVRGNEIAMIFQEPMTSLNPVWPIGDQVSEERPVPGARPHDDGGGRGDQGIGESNRIGRRRGASEDPRVGADPHHR